MKNHFTKRVADTIEITALDIGGRGGPDSSLAPISDLVSWILFEPDLEECKRLKSLGSMNWQDINVIEVGIGKEKQRTLNLYRQRGCSSLLEADSSLAKRFAREDYYILDDTVEVSMTGLDQALEENSITDVSYLKIDIQGAEIEALKSGKKLLSEQLVMLRTEVSFLPIYKEQPLFSEVEQFLRGFGFELLKFVETHHWRRRSKVKFPTIDKDRRIASTGQLIHGDALFFKSPETIVKSTESDGTLLIKLAFLAFAYGEVDLSADCLTQSSSISKLKELNLDASEVIDYMTQSHLKQARKEGYQSRIKDLIRFLLNKRV